MDTLMTSYGSIIFALIYFAGGVLITVIAKCFINKRGSFIYHVTHNRIGLSADDKIYGSVKVTWNDTPVHRLYLSMVEIENVSMKDFSSVTVRVYTNNTALLSQGTQIVGTTHSIDFTEEYERKLAVLDGKTPSQSQWDLYRNERDYFVPTMNRGQKLRLEILNAAMSDEQPCIWLDILHKGVVCKFQIPQAQIFGVPRLNAVYIGMGFSFIIVVAITIYFKSLFWVSLLSYFIGVYVVVPGAYAIKSWRKIWDLMAS